MITAGFHRINYGLCCLCKCSKACLLSSPLLSHFLRDRCSWEAHLVYVQCSLSCLNRLLICYHFNCFPRLRFICKYVYTSIETQKHPSVLNFFCNIFLTCTFALSRTTENFSIPYWVRNIRINAQYKENTCRNRSFMTFLFMSEKGSNKLLYYISSHKWR